MTKFSIIHPSRGRAIKAAATCEQWLNNYSTYTGCEYILSLDQDDAPGQLSLYGSLFGKLKKTFPSIVFKIVYGVNQNVVKAMNNGAMRAEGEILVCISDDFDCFKDWDVKLSENIDVNKGEALLVNQGIDKYQRNMAIPIMTKKLYERLGYIYYPAYTGMFADDDLTEACNVLGVLKVNKDITFQHNHYTNHKAAMDATYRRHNNKASWELGQRVMERRRSQNFGS